MHTSFNGTDGAAAIGGLFGLIVGLLIGLVLAVVYAILCGMVANKAGYPTWYGFLTLIPGVGLILLIIFAVAEWPVEREVRELKERAGLQEPEPEPDTTA